jgi:4-carboxymuconolactone decarboxylase
VDNRKEMGLDVIQKLFKRAPSADAIDFDLMQMSIEHLFGNVWSRPQLSLRDRELVTLAVLMAGGWERQLKTHAMGALNAGLSRDEIIETAIHVAHYAGFPAGFTALAVLRDLFAEIDATVSE